MKEPSAIRPDENAASSDESAKLLQHATTLVQEVGRVYQEANSNAATALSPRERERIWCTAMSVLEKLAADPNQDSETVCTLVETLRGYMGMWEHTHPQVGEYHPHLDAIVRDAQRTRLNRVLGKELFGMESPSVGAL